MNDFWNPGSFQITARSGCEIFMDGGGASPPAPIGALAMVTLGAAPNAVTAIRNRATDRTCTVVSEVMC